MSVTIHDLRAWKAEGTRWAMLTAYDFPTAQILSEAGIPVLLVGDSLGNNVLGYETTLPVTMREMLHHTRAVARGAGDALVVGDMPFLSYQVSVEEGIRNAGRFLKEGGAHAVKLEGPQLELTHRLVEIGIPVMGHVGLTPQSVHGMGGYKVQGRGEEAARRLVDQAHAIEKVGAFSIVLEGMPAELGHEITTSVGVPTIGIGAGPHCDAQVLVINDLLGLASGIPRFAKTYANLRESIGGAARAFAADVRTGSFPDEEHTYR
jgi:3-methyl-2-oxobutanoate hydroxymethyltransferase